MPRIDPSQSKQHNTYCVCEVQPHINAEQHVPQNMERWLMKAATKDEDKKTNSKSKNDETAAPVKAAPPVYAPPVRHKLRHSAEQLVASALATITCAAPVADENTRHAGASRAAEQK